MTLYWDLFSGDEILSDSFPYNELFNGVLWEVEGKWVVKGAPDVDPLIGANASAEGGEEDVGADVEAVKVVDIVDTFRLQEQPAFEKKVFMRYMKKYVMALARLLPVERKDSFNKDTEAAVNFLMTKLSDLQFFLGESQKDDSSLVFAYNKDGATDPTFLYFGDALRVVY